MEVYLVKPDNLEFDLENADLLFKTNKIINVGEVISYQGNNYVCTQLESRKNDPEIKCGIRPIELNLNNEGEYGNSTIVCPICGYNFDELPTNEEGEVKCPNCGSLLQFSCSLICDSEVIKSPEVLVIDDEGLVK